MIIGIDASRAFFDDRTGTENYSYYLINEIVRLPESKNHTFILFTRPNAILPRELVGYTNVIIKKIDLTFLWTQIGLAAATWQKIPRSDLENGLDNLAIEVLWIPAHTLPILRNPKIPTVVTIHGLEYQWLREYKNLLQRWYLPLSTIYAALNATKLIAVSNFTQSELIKELQNRSKNPTRLIKLKEKIQVIHEGVQIERKTLKPDQIQQVRQKYAIEDKSYLLFVGTIQPRKNLPALIEAFAQLPSFTKSGQSPLKLVIAGSSGWMVEEVYAAVERFAVADRVVFTGRVSDLELKALYLGAKIYIQPSITEGFGLPLLEAMNLGIPVVCSDGGALPEVVLDSAVVVPLKDKHESFPKRLTKAIGEILENREMAAQLRKKGKSRVSQMSWAKVAKETLNILVTTGLNNNR